MLASMFLGRNGTILSGGSVFSQRVVEYLQFDRGGSASRNFFLTRHFIIHGYAQPA